MTACIVTLIFLSIFKNSVINDIDNLDSVWYDKVKNTFIEHWKIKKKLNKIRRLCIGFGCIPAACALYFRLTIPESPRYTIEINNDIETLVKDVDIVVQNKTKEVKDSGKETNENKATFREFLQHFRQWKNLKVLIGCSVSWFALDVAFYGINLNTSIIISSIGFSGNLKTNSTVEIWESMFSNTVGNIIGKLISLEFKVYF